MFRQAMKRSALGSPIEMEQMMTSHSLQLVTEWSNNHEFLSPNEINTRAVGLLFCLTTKRLINIPFTTLYHRSLKMTWIDLFNRERRNLKSNINSVKKCFMINRLIAEYNKDPCQFAHQTGELYEEIKVRMSSILPLTETLEDLYSQVQIWRNLQCQRRLFHITHDEVNRPQGLLILQQFVNILFPQFLNSCRINPTRENFDQLKQLLQHSFIIVAQPSIPECVAATKYEKSGNAYIAKLSTRIICLLDRDTIAKHLTLSDVGVTVYPLDRNIDPLGEDQQSLSWKEKSITDSEEVSRSVMFVELEYIALTKQDTRNTRPLYSAKLCQLQFHIRIRIHEPQYEENLPFLSQPFGLCSHAQYYPEYVAKVLLHELSHMSQTSGFIIQPDILTTYIARYHIRIAGVEMKSHTSQYITSVLQRIYDERKSIVNITAFEIYEEIVSKIISQMEMFIDHPFLSMMYHDGLFLGICNSALDQQLRGTREEPNILLRFNSLPTHQAIQHASVRFIVHNGQLTRATFHAKAFVDEICRMICEANCDRAKQIRLLFDTSPHHFDEYSLYFDDELFRLHTAASPLKDAYQPFIPVLWNTMRTNTDPNESQLDSPSLSFESIPIDLSQASASSTNEIQIDLSSIIATNDRSKVSNEKVTIQTDMLVHHVVEKLSDLLTRSSADNLSSTPPHIARASTLISTLTQGNIHYQKELLSHLLDDYFQSRTRVQIITQTSIPGSDNSPDRISEDTQP